MSIIILFFGDQWKFLNIAAIITIHADLTKILLITRE